MKYKLELDQLITIANKSLTHKHNPTRIKLERYNGYAIIAVDSIDENETRISPRMSIKNLCNWLNGFIAGLEF